MLVKTLFATFVVAVFATLPVRAQAPRMPDKRIKILLLGTWHFDVNSTPDAGKTDVKDLLSPKRQREIDNVVAPLAAFRPDKIFVEAPLSRQMQLDSTLQLLKAGKLADTARKNEIFQLAMKTARQTGATVRAVDVPANIDIKPLDGFPEKDLDTTLRNAFTIDFRKRPPSLTRMMAADSTIGQMLRALNSPAYQVFYNYDYIHWLPAYNTGQNYAGVDVAMSWYARNMKIFVNVMRNVDVQRDQRYVLIFGSSHIPQLKHYFATHPLFEVVDVTDVLR